MKNLILLFTLLSGAVWAETYPLPTGNNNVIGEIKTINVENPITLSELGRKYGVGFNEITQANPELDAKKAITGEVIIPTQFILPDTLREGLVVNLPEMRLYYYPKGKNEVVTFPVGIGQRDWATPMGETFIKSKKINPTWMPTAKIRAEAIAKGKPLPEVVPAGPNNPLGTRAMHLALDGSFLIHGTNKPLSIGKRASHGCIRMRKEDIEALFDKVKVNDSVRLINQPLKIGFVGKKLMMEYHRPLVEYELTVEQNIANAIATAKRKVNFTDHDLSASIIESIVRTRSGVAEVVEE